MAQSIQSLDHSCTSWCTVGDHDAAHDPACWGQDEIVALSLEEGFPNAAVDPLLVDSPRATVIPYRQEPGYREVAKLHLYRNSHNEYRELDAEVVMTTSEARQLADVLLAAADLIDGSEPMCADLHTSEPPPTVWYGSAPQFDARVSRTEANYLDATRKFIDSAQFYLGEIVDDLPDPLRIRGNEILDRLGAAMTELERLQAAGS